MKKKKEKLGQNVPISEILVRLDREKSNNDEIRLEGLQFDTILTAKISKKFVADEVKKIENLIDTERKLEKGTKKMMKKLRKMKKMILRKK